MTHGALADAYGLARPDCRSAHDALERIFGDEVAPVWHDLLAVAGVDDPNANDDASFQRILAAIQDNAHPVVKLCGRALQIRWDSYRHLAAAQAQVEGR